MIMIESAIPRALEVFFAAAKWFFSLFLWSINDKLEGTFIWFIWAWYLCCGTTNAQRLFTKWIINLYIADLNWSAPYAHNFYHSRGWKRSLPINESFNRCAPAEHLKYFPISRSTQLRSTFSTLSLIDDPTWCWVYIYRIELVFGTLKLVAINRRTIFHRKYPPNLIQFHTPSLQTVTRQYIIKMKCMKWKWIPFRTYLNECCHQRFHLFILSAQPDKSNASETANHNFGNDENHVIHGGDGVTSANGKWYETENIIRQLEKRKVRHRASHELSVCHSVAYLHILYAQRQPNVCSLLEWMNLLIYATKCVDAVRVMTWKKMRCNDAEKKRKKKMGKKGWRDHVKTFSHY